MRMVILICVALATASTPAPAAVEVLQSTQLKVEVDTVTGRWVLIDKRSGVRWPSEGTANAGKTSWLEGEFGESARVGADTLRLRKADGRAVVFAITADPEALELRYEGKDTDTVRALEDVLTIERADAGYVIVPCREGLLIPADSGKAFKWMFGTSEYEGCHMNMMGFVKQGSALIVTWDDAYVFGEVRSVIGDKAQQRLTTTFELRGPADTIRLMPLGQGDWNTIAAAYRRYAEKRGFAVTLREKIRRDQHVELLAGAANVKLWTCLARRMNEESTAEESVKVRWTFDEAAQIAEHLHNDMGIERCLFMMGGWTEGGYDCRHPDNLPANPECGGNVGLADAIRRIQKLGYVACLHDNVQDMYRDAKSWNPDFIEKREDGSLIKGGRWLGGRAYMVCAPKQLELAKRPQNLPATQRLFAPWSYFIDTTYAVGPRECHDPNHPIGRNDDIAWKIRLSDYARRLFGIFGSECGREWALPHSDFFEGLVGVSGRYYHSLKPEQLGATVIPFFEMVYHDCQICYGKYGYSADKAAEYVAHHVLCARPLHYHSIPDHLYFQTDAGRSGQVMALPRVVSVKPVSERTFDISYAWKVSGDVKADWSVFVHFAAADQIVFQDDHGPQPGTSQWKQGQTIEIGPHRLVVPESIKQDVLNVYVGLYDPSSNVRARTSGSDDERRVLVGQLALRPAIRFEQAKPPEAPAGSCYTQNDGWAKDLHPVDVFLKNTHEVLGPLHEAAVHQRLRRLEFLTEDRTVRRATFGAGASATRITVNFGAKAAHIQSQFGGEVVLPQWGFVAEAPRFMAFYAKRWAGHDYERGALFTLKSQDEHGLAASRRVRIFHGFGPSVIRWKDKTHEVKRDLVIRP